VDDLPQTSSQFRGLLRAQINEKIDKKTNQIFQERAFGFRGLLRAQINEKIDKKTAQILKNGRLG
jgi:hypothetical protein